MFERKFQPGRAGPVADANLIAENDLAISGGGDNGAFGAGLLTAWTKKGDRPSFDVVTGVSAGALIAPFAFLGPNYDDILQRLWSSLKANRVVRLQSLGKVIHGDALLDTSPLKRLMDEFITCDLLSAIAREHAQGRRLYIGTTDLDAGAFVIWDMGAIASNTDSNSLKLFRQIMLASIAIPGLFPPALIDVNVKGKHFQEMHVDGSIVRNVFLPSSDGHVANRHIYVIYNGSIAAESVNTPRHSLDIAARALAMLSRSKTADDLFRLQVLAEDEGATFEIAQIGSDFSCAHSSIFDLHYMHMLFQYSFAQGIHGRWFSASMTASLASHAKMGL